ncbi:NACHT domain-containing protein [Streptomyces sp. NPDC051776]|uniref:NACHT domain-containing protein n=1 Tax=Streptomyces sp. NPDC051776 TaxID=3155414 RepID=UPI00342983A0
MVGSRTRRVGLVFLAMLVLSLALALWLSKQFHVETMAATLLSVVLAAPGTGLAWFAYRGDRNEAALDLDAKARTLSAVVLAAETEQVKQLLGRGGHRIDVSFRYTPEPANNAAGADPHGRLSDVLRYYRQLQPTRLVITGEPGAGKTMLALHLLLSVLADPARTDTDPVPVCLSLARWDTVQPLQRWIAEQVGERFRDRGITPADAAALVDLHRILPILDGLDEMDLDGTPVARRRATRALDQLNAYQNALGSAPVVVTCRTAQYAELAGVDVRMREAAHVEIAPVDHGRVAAYLTARTTCPRRWEPVRTLLAAAPGGTLGRSLHTPWRLNLAVTVYEQRHPDTLAYLHDPAELCALPSPSAVRDHLLARYLPAATSQHPERPDRYTAQQTHQWLAALADHLAGTATTTGGRGASGPGTDLVLHQLWPMAGRTRVRAADTLVTGLITVTFALLLVLQVPAGLPTRQLLAGAAPALAGVLAVWRACSASVPAPRAGQLQRLRSEAKRRQLRRAVMGGLAGALAFALVGALAGALALGPTGALTAALGASVTGGLAGALTLALTGSAADTAPRSDFVPPTDPRHLVRDDALFGLTLGLTGALSGGLMSGLTGGLAIGLPVGRSAGMWFGVTGGLAIGMALGLCLLGGAGRRYGIFLLCSRGRLPWTLRSFLHWAYEAGLLRISGMAYQFRHRELQDWLVAHPRPDTRSARG